MSFLYQFKSKYYIFSLLWILIGILVASYLIYEKTIMINYNQLEKILKQEDVKEILVDSQTSYFYTIKGNIYEISSKELFSPSIIVGTQSKTQESQTYTPPTSNLQLKTLPNISSKTPFSTKIIYATLIILIGLVIIFVFYNNNQWNKDSQSNFAPQHDTQSDSEISIPIESMKSQIRFSDVAGISEVKDDLLEIIDYLKNPKKYQDLGIYPPKGVLLVGPPGVGKTMLAKAIAGESGVPFFYQSGSSFVQIYVGVGAKRVRELFAKARMYAPSIIFIDEIDAVGKTRGGKDNHEWESTLNELLTEMDGFSDQSGVIVIAATNQVDVIDPALLRSGRFDRRIFVDLPNITEREDILRVYLRNRPHSLNIQEIARLCTGFSGANIASLVNEAAMNALRHKRQEITMQDILDNTEKVLFGKKRQNPLTHKQKEIIALYNAGKAISQYWLSHDFQKISLMQLPQHIKIDDNSLRSELIAQIKIALSGTLSLEENNIESSTIAMQDINNAKYIAHKMCHEFGMGDRLIADELDELRILENAKEEHRDFIISNKKNIHIIAENLLLHEKLSKEEIESILSISDT